MPEPVVISGRFNGPPDSAHGGYTCGLVAERIGETAAVSLRMPPPLDRPMERRADDERVVLLNGDAVVAEGAPAELELEVPAPVSIDEAEEASARCPWIDRHPFPTCFGCGPRRSQDEAIAVLMGPVEGRDGLWAGSWTPLAAFAEGDGAVTPRYMWAALDCPTSAPAIPPTAGPSVLARLTARVLEPARPGEPHVVTAWTLGHDGRKHRGAAAIHTSRGELCAYSEGLWLELRS